MEVSFFSEAPKVELQRFQFYIELIRDIPDVDVSEVGLSRLRTKASEFWAIKFDDIVTLWIRVGKSFHRFRGLGGHGVSFPFFKI